MESFVSKVIADGRVTIPKKKREELSIDDGDLVELSIVRVISTGEK